jgi:hypothetical protein
MVFYDHLPYGFRIIEKEEENIVPKGCRAKKGQKTEKKNDGVPKKLKY